jgi:hypothetical protein
MSVKRNQHLYVFQQTGDSRTQTLNNQHHVNFISLQSILLANFDALHKFQGGSNMTRTDYGLFTHNKSRSYLNHLVTPWSRVHPEKLRSPQLVNIFPAFHGTQRFITAFTTARYLSLS